MGAAFTPDPRSIPDGFDVNDPTLGVPPGLCAAPRFGKLWPYVKDEDAYVCASDKPGLYVPGSITGGGGNGKFSYVMFATAGLRSPEEGMPSRLSDPVSGGPRGGGTKQYRLAKQPLPRIPIFVPEHPEGIGIGGGHCEGNFNYDTDRAVARHAPFRSRLGYRPGQNTVSRFKQGVTNIAFGDGHVELVAINHRFTATDVRPKSSGGNGYPGIPETADGLLYHFGLVYQEVHALPGGGVKYDTVN
jgi:prepilin-type processing-associated H-X9-DG protein